MDEPNHRFWDTIIKAGTALAAIAVFIPSFLQYRSESAKNVLMLDFERGKILLQQSKDDILVLREAIDTVRLIQRSKSQKDLGKAISKFWKLYWVDLIGVEDKNVESAMVQIGSIIKKYDFHETDNLLGDGQSDQFLEMTDQLERASEELNVACMNQIKRIKEDIKKLVFSESKRNV